MSLDAATVQAILDAAVSHAQASGLFDRVQTHEPKSSPGSGVTAAFWVQDIGPVPIGSGLAATTARIELAARLYTSMLAEPADLIDPALLAACATLIGAYSGDFTLDGLVQQVDLLGMAGPPLAARAGYLGVDNKVYRVMTITLPVIVADAWEQVP